MGVVQHDLISGCEYHLAGRVDRSVLVSVTRRDSISSLPDQFGWCLSTDLSAVVADAGLAAVTDLIRSLSALRGVTHHSPVVAVCFPGRH